MTARRVSLILHGERSTEADKELLPNNWFCPETEALLGELWKTSSTVIRQANELTEILPHNAEKYAEQRIAEVMRLSRDFLAKMEVVA